LGGQLTVDWDEKTNHVFIDGPATTVFSGVGIRSFNDYS
jgi:diaminopimelate epimerase (EC 5.1.1.7)